MAKLRKIEDHLYRDYQTVIDGRKELQLNRERARQIYETVYQEDAAAWRHHIVRADTYHLSAVNWSNIMTLGAIGIVFFMANSSLGWANTAVGGGRHLFADAAVGGWRLANPAQRPSGLP